jgi:hypothetical protein
VFMAAFFTLAVTCKQPVSMNKWVDHESEIYAHINGIYIIYVQNTILFSLKRQEILPFATMWMKLENVKPDTKRLRMHNLIYMWKLKKLNL